MSEIQVVTLLATLLGLVATVLNLVAFVREKDRSHTRAGFAALSLLILVLAVAFMPRYAPSAARALVSAMPEPAGVALQPWLSSSGVAAPAPTEAGGVLGSFTIEIQRNMFGGIGALVSNFQFSNPSEHSVRVTAYHVRITPRLGETTRSYDRVLPEPLTVAADGTARTQVELDAEIRDQWVSREDLDAAERGPIVISWECEDALGRAFQLTSSNG
jgi:hypothetical protein